jgi:mannose/fructose/N-acetylgalactosamine-specific phosphotransferase system component IIC
MIENIFILALIASICALDVTAFGQFMICRPIFCAPLFGYLTGDIYTGLWLGMIIELIWINSLPLGVAVPVDIVSVSILSVFWACKFLHGSQSAAIWGIFFAVPFAYFYRELDVLNRNFNIRIMHWVENGIKNGKENRINYGIFFSLLLFFVRIYAFYLITMTIGSWLFQGIYLQFPAVLAAGFKKAWYLLPVLGFGASLYNFRNVRLPIARR